MEPQLRELWKRLDSCLLADVPRLRKAIRSAAGVADDAERAGRLDRVSEQIGRSQALRHQRRGRIPSLTYPDDLPVAERRAEIAAAIRDHQVVVLCGATGSGKTTQLPKICLELGRGVAGMIGHTQPRRIAARSVAARVAAELKGDPGRQSAGESAGESGTLAGGGIVGCSVRFDDRTGPETMVRLMTDGILLAETQRDPHLRRYDTIIVDEAHERSLNIDFLLGYLHRLLPKRPELKVIITSATIDPERFAAHFGGAPIVMVEGRTHPVEIRWRPVEAEEPDEEDPTLQTAILDAVDELAEHDRGNGLAPGDVLIFLSGEREIHETAAALRGRLRAGDETLPLYARLSNEEQDRVFRAHGGRRIVLATNVAETSLTVPGIRHVVDSGLARISRRSSRTMVQRLPIERISRASADQRAGRCGRTGPGVCIRLYSEADYAERPQYTDPEIVRTELASVILRTKALKLGPIESFPFPDPPSPRAIAAGVETLVELGAIDRSGSLTSVGRRLARWPIDPRLGRMLVTAETEGVLAETIVIVAGLAIQDPRIRPSQSPEMADLAHARFRDGSSDFVSILRLWDEWRRRRDTRSADALGSSALRRWCRENSLSWLRMREWEATHRQIVELLLREGPPASSAVRAMTADDRRADVVASPIGSARTSSQQTASTDPGPKVDSTRRKRRRKRRRRGGTAGSSG